MQESSQWLLRYRRAVSVGVHLALFATAQVGAFGLRFDFSVPSQYLPMGPLWLVTNLIIRLAVFWAMGLFSGMWRYTGARDLAALVKATALSSLIYAGFVVVAGYRNHPRSILIIDFLLTMILVGGLRFMVRSLWQTAATVTKGKAKDGKRLRVLVVGAGNAGEMLVREMQRNHGGRFEPVCFVDDDGNKQGVSIHGVRVLGRLSAVPELVVKERIDEVVIAIPSASSKAMRLIVERVKSAGVPLRMIPGIDQLIDGRVTINQLRSVHIEDLLGREPVKLDIDSLSGLLKGKVVMVTGSGGSIGSELCRQLVRFEPQRLLLVERSEPALFEIHREMLAKAPGVEVVPCVADIGDHGRMRSLFGRHRPGVVVHAAAHKHVPMMEWNPGEAIKNNVGGTRVVADLAHEFGVRPVRDDLDGQGGQPDVGDGGDEAGGRALRAGDERAESHPLRRRALRQRARRRRGASSRSSRSRSRAGGPVTVTHPDMRRYFMTIPEASQLVLQAASMGLGGEIFVLDMGEPVKIVDLARDLITSLRAGAGSATSRSASSGLRPGEKLFEELSTADENAEKTRHPKIFIGKLKSRSWEGLVREVETLQRAADELAPAEAVNRLKAIVPEFRREPVPMAKPVELRLPATASSQVEGQNLREGWQGPLD